MSDAVGTTGRAREELDVEGRVRSAGQRALDDSRAAGAGRRRDHREVLEVVGSGVRIVGVVRRDAIAEQHVVHDPGGAPGRHGAAL